MKTKIIFLVVLLVLQAANVFAQAPVAAYGFSEGSGTTTADASGNSQSASLSNTVWTTSGKFGNALEFNGTSSKVTIANTPLIQLNLKMTLEAWVYPTSSVNQYRDVLIKGGENYYLSGRAQGTGLAGAGGHLSNGSWTEVYSTNALPLNTWSHIAFTADGSKFTFYVNGVATSSKVQPSPFVVTTKPLEIGFDSTYGQYFAGRIDEVRVYNRALTQAEIQTDMNTPVAPVSTITITDKHPDDPVVIKWDYDPAFASEVNGFGLYASANPTGPWQFYDGIPDPIQRTFTFVAPDRSTYFTMNACKQTASNNGFCSIFSNIVKINCVSLSEQFLWQTFTTRVCQ